MILSTFRQLLLQEELSYFRGEKFHFFAGRHQVDLGFTGKIPIHMTMKEPFVFSFLSRENANLMVCFESIS